MTRYLAGRLVRALLTVWGVLTVVFFLIRLNGSPAALMLPSGATPADVRRLNDALGFNRPLSDQYWRFLRGAVHGDFGDSLRQSGTALGLVLARIPATVELAVSGFLVGTVLAFACVLIVQLTGGRRLRTAFLWIGTLRQAVPTFLFGVLVVLVFSIELQWFPPIGRGGPEHLVLPALTIGTFEFTLYLRLLDSALTEQAGMDYARTAYAKGQSHAGVVLRHLLPNALLPILTVAGLNLGGLLGGAVIIETVFDWPGAGQLIIQSVTSRDFPVVEAGLLVVSVIFVVINLLTDLLYSLVDPRVRIA